MACAVPSSEDDYDDLWEIEWVQIPDVPYIVKYKFEKNKYIILVTDLKDIYGEILTATQVKERFSILNPHAEMKPSVIMKHIKESLEHFLRKDVNDSKCVQQCIPHPKVAITIQLAFIVSQVLVTFEIKPQILPSEKLRTHLIAPTVITTSILCRGNDKKNTKAMFNMQENRNLGDSKLKKKSKISEVELLETFLATQSTMKRCICASNFCEDKKKCIPASNICEDKKRCIPASNICEDKKRCTRASNFCEDNYNSQQMRSSSSKSRLGENDSLITPLLSGMPFKKELEGLLTLANISSSKTVNSFKSENHPTLKVENDPLSNDGNDSSSEIPSKKKKRKTFKI